MNKGEIWLGRFPFGGRVGAKTRPVVALTSLVGPVPEILTAYVTTDIPTVLLPTDLLLDPARPEHASTNLKTVSVVRLHKLASVHQRDLFRQLGSVSTSVIAELEQRLRILLGL